MIFDIRFDNVSMSETLDYILGSIDNFKKLHITKKIFTLNTHFVILSKKDPLFLNILNASDLNVADGMPIVLMSKLLGKSLKEKVSGSSLFFKVCELASKKNLNIFLLGGAPGVAELAKINLVKQFNGLNIVGTYSPPFGFETDAVEILNINSILQKSGADILLVGLSTGKGEKWIFNNSNSYMIPVTIQNGAAIDFAAGIKKMPPEFLKKIGLAWLFRLIREPKHLFKRYLIQDIKIIYYFLIEYFSLKGSK